jgi:hypothetical protein
MADGGYDISDYCSIDPVFGLVISMSFYAKRINAVSR